MLSFELSAIDLILAVAVVILLILYITKLSGKSPIEEKLLLEKENSSKGLMTEAVIQKEERESLTAAQPKPQTDSAKCPFGFGYLKKLDKEASIPDDCLHCSRIMECYSAGA